MYPWYSYTFPQQVYLLKAVVGGPAGPAMAGPVLGHNKKFLMCSNLLQVLDPTSGVI